MLSIVALLQFAVLPPERIDLLATPRRCPVDTTDVVVCARDPRADRLAPLPAPPTSGKPEGPLSFRLPGGGTAKAEAMQSMLPGAIGQGARVTLRIPLGRRRQE